MNLTVASWTVQIVLVFISLVYLYTIGRRQSRTVNRKVGLTLAVAMCLNLLVMAIASMI